MHLAVVQTASSATTTSKRTISSPCCRIRSNRPIPHVLKRRAALATSRLAAVATAEVEVSSGAQAMERSELKMALLDSFWGTERGLAASSDSRAEINELISQLEARNPTPEPNEAQAALAGAWRLAYTSNSELIALLALARLPLVRVGDIEQFIDPLGQTVENRVQLEAPLSKTSLSATASFEVRSPKLLQVSFEEGRVATPQLLADLRLPASLSLLGQQVDLTPLQALVQQVEGPLQTVLGTLSGLLSQVPDLRIPVRNVQASSWLLNTYLDDTMRITRGDGGSVFVLVRDGTTMSDFSNMYGGASVMSSTDWQAFEERDPAPASTAGVDVAAASVAAAASGDGSAAAAVEAEVEVLQDGDAPTWDANLGSTDRGALS